MPSSLPDARVRPSGLNATLLRSLPRMPGEGALVRPGDRIPQTDGVVIPTPRCEGETIRTERYAIDTPRMPGEGAFGAPR